MGNLGLVIILLVGAVMSGTIAAGQDSTNPTVAQVGFVLPITITGNTLYSRRVEIDDPSAAKTTAGFRILASPQLRLGSHWYVYSALEINSTPFFYADAFLADRTVETDLMQGFAGYTRGWGKTTLGLKFGKLTTAFGSFPLRYDDAVNPLLDQPLNFYPVKLRPDQLPCGNSDFHAKGEVEFNCGGGSGETYGIQAATLYGLPGAEMDLSWRRVDARVQITNSSPANPRGLFTSHQHLQWTAGAGVTIRQGFRVGMSAYRGPWLDHAVAPYLPAGSTVSDFNTTGFGVDVQWAHGPWSANGEWGLFNFSYPNFRTSPRSNFAYGELKRIINPRWYSAVRINFGVNNHPEDFTGTNPDPYQSNSQAYEVAVGFRPGRFYLLKVGYEWMRMEGAPQTHDNVLGVQFVVTPPVLSKALR